MPSPKTAEKSAPKSTKSSDLLVEVIAVRKFAVDYTAEEMSLLQSDAKGGSDQTGMTRMVEVGESAKISKNTAGILQDAGAIKIKL